MSAQQPLLPISRPPSYRSLDGIGQATPPPTYDEAMGNNSNSNYCQVASRARCSCSWKSMLSPVGFALVLGGISYGIYHLYKATID